MFAVRFAHWAAPAFPRAPIVGGSRRARTSASFFFACSQSASSSGGERSSSGRGAARSISLKRRRKRRLQLRNAISASTPRCRPRLTTVNSRSPSSASTADLRAGYLSRFRPIQLRLSSSAVSSATLGSSSRQLGQSKPDFCALAPSLAASASAGMRAKNAVEPRLRLLLRRRRVAAAVAAGFFRSLDLFPVAQNGG